MIQYIFEEEQYIFEKNIKYFLGWDILECCVTCNVRVEVYEPLQGDVGREALDAVVRHPVLRPALGTLYLPLDVVHQALRLAEVSHVTPTSDQ